MKFEIVIFIAAGLMLFGCTSKGPQRPSQRKSGESTQVHTSSVDSTLTALDLNQQLVETADEQIYRFVLTQEEGYALYEQGTWVHLYHTGDPEQPIRPQDEYTAHMRVTSLSGTLYMDTEQTAHAGRGEMLSAIDDNITEWHRGAHLRLVAPWYSAFGIRGTNTVPPYENVIIELDIQ